MKKKMQVQTANIVNLGNVLSNPIRRKIIEVLIDKGPKNITDLQYEFKIRSYKNIHKHVQLLLEAGLIETIQAPYKEGVKLETSREKVSNLLISKLSEDIRYMLYLPFHDKLEKYIREKKEATEDEVLTKFPDITKNMFRWYLLFFGSVYDLKISVSKKWEKR